MKLSVLVLLLALGACSLLPERPPAAAAHDFGLAEKNLVGGNAAWSSVQVDAPDWLQTENIRYRLLYAEPTQVRSYTLDRWLAPPPALLAQHLALNGGGRGYALKLRLLEFEQVFDGPQQARMILVFRAVATRPGDDASVGEKLFHFVRPAPSADAKGAVTAAAALVNEAASALAAWLEALGNPQ